MKCHTTYKKIFGCLIIAGMILVTEACEEPLSVDYFKPEPEIVVDGLITDQPGPYTIRINYMGAYTLTSDGNNPPVSGAIVKIYDDAGNAELLQERSSGVYQTDPDGIQGVVGRSYTINIQTVEGLEIESYPEKMTQVPEVDSIYYFFKPLSPTNRQGHEVGIYIKDPPGETNYYRWKWEGYYSYFLVSEMVTIGCFKKEFDRAQINVVSDKDLNGNIFDRPVTFVEHFANDKYLIHVFQQSLTEGAYEFWNAVFEQGNKAGSIVDPPPANIRGNLFYTDGRKEQVHGYFGASAIKMKYRLMNFNTNVRPIYLRDYPFQPSCDAYPVSIPFDPSYPETWPEGWE
jgi:hypothetical protein